MCSVILVQPSLAAAERVFQEYALRDYIDTLVMYNLFSVCDAHVHIPVII